MVLKSRLLIKNFNYFTDHPLKRRATRRARAGSVRRQSSKTKRQGSVRSGSHSIGPGTTPGGKLSTFNSKVRKSRKQFMGSSILPKAKKLTLGWKLSQRLFFGRIIEDTIICFRDFPTFTYARAKFYGLEYLVSITLPASWPPTILCLRERPNLCTPHTGSFIVYLETLYCSISIRKRNLCIVFYEM